MGGRAAGAAGDDLRGPGSDQGAAAAAPDPCAPGDMRPAEGESAMGRDTATRREYLRRVPLFAALEDDHLAELLEMSDEVEVPAGHVIFREGDAGDNLYVVLTGELEVSKRVREVDDLIATRGPGEVVGEMALVNGKPRTATVRAFRDSRLLRVGQEAFRSLLGSSPEAAAAIVGCMATRIEEDQANRAREERLMALGTMAAGLAHELNNPASALVRASASLGAAHEARDAAAVQLFASELTPPERDAVVRLGALAKERADAAPQGPGHLPDPADEDELADYLEDLGLEQPWEAAPALLQAGWTLPAVDEVLAGFEPANRVAAARWLAADAVARGLLAEIRLASNAIVEQVRAVKVSSHMDRAAFDEVDVHEGLESALVMVKRKLGPGVTVERDYDRGLPRIEAYPGELNQVWTNLIDNALDAMGGEGTLTLRTRAGEGQVTVEIGDTGPGIPADVMPRLFQPYFTTKGVGEGTGLGLPLARKTVEQRHGGRITVRSEPGATVFRVTLPTVHRRPEPGTATEGA